MHPLLELFSSFCTSAPPKKKGKYLFVFFLFCTNLQLTCVSLHEFWDILVIIINSNLISLKLYLLVRLTFLAAEMPTYSCGQKFTGCANGGRSARPRHLTARLLVPTRHTASSFGSARMRRTASRHQAPGRQMAPLCSPAAARTTRKKLSGTAPA